MVASRPQMRVVELIEDDGAPDAAVPDARARTGRGTGAGTGAGSRSPTPLRADAAPGPRAHRRGWRLAATTVAVALAAAVGDLTADARARAGVAALATVPGVVGTLDRPLVELWRGDPLLRPELGEAGGYLVGLLGERGAADVVGLDPATGAVVWRTRVRATGRLAAAGGVRCVVPDPAPPGVAPPSAGPRGAPAPYAVCVVDRAAPRPPGESPRRAPEDRLVTLDARDGTVLADRTVAPSTVLSALGRDVVTGYVDTQGHVHVARTDPLGDRVRWTFVTPRPLPRTHLAWSTRIVVEGGVVVVDEADGWVLSGDGEVVHSWRAVRPPGADGTSQVVGAGRYHVRDESHDGARPRTRVTDLRTGRSFDVPGRPLATRPDDGTAAAGVLVRAAGSGDLATVEPGGGTSWRTAGGVQGTPLVVDGRLVRLGSADLSSIDARSGRVVWSTPLRRTARSSLVTDGRLVATTRLDPDDGVVLSAYGLDDGRPRWDVDLADDVGTLMVFGDRVFGWTGEQVVALGPTTG